MPVPVHRHVPATDTEEDPLLPRSVRNMRRQLTRLPEAGGATEGLTEHHGPGPARPPLRLVMIGDSVAAGVGAPALGEALAGHLAAALTRMTGRPVSWRVSARAGATLPYVRRSLLTGLTDPTSRWTPDLVLVVAGTNDALRLCRPRAFRAEARRLVRDIRLRLGDDVPVVFTGLPDLRGVEGLPAAMRAPLGQYVRLLDRQLLALARQDPGVHHLYSGGMPEIPGSWIAEDRFHPSPEGYRAWARVLAGRLSTLTETLLPDPVR